MPVNLIIERMFPTDLYITILIFPIISKIISYIKHRSLIIQLQQEGRIKEILASVGDYVKKDDFTSNVAPLEIGGTATENA